MVHHNCFFWVMQQKCYVGNDLSWIKFKIIFFWKKFIEFLTRTVLVSTLEIKFSLIFFVRISKVINNPWWVKLWRNCLFYFLWIIKIGFFRLEANIKWGLEMKSCSVDSLNIFLVFFHRLIYHHDWNPLQKIRLAMIFLWTEAFAQRNSSSAYSNVV